MEKMLVTQGLNELKLLDQRIQRETRQAIFVSSAKTIEKKVTPNMTKEDFCDRAKSSYQSLMDLIKRRSAIKAAIVASNAVTNVMIGEEEMTVADAIERKSSIEYEEGVLQVMKNQLEKAKSTMNTQNVLMQDKIDKNIETMLGKEGKAKDEDLKSMMDMFREANQWSLVDPLLIEDKITELSSKIEVFKSEVDSALQISNCITWIEF